MSSCWFNARSLRRQAPSLQHFSGALCFTVAKIHTVCGMGRFVLSWMILEPRFPNDCLFFQPTSFFVWRYYLEGFDSSYCGRTCERSLSHSYVQCTVADHRSLLDFKWSSTKPYSLLTDMRVLSSDVKIIPFITSNLISLAFLYNINLLKPSRRGL